MMTHNYQLNGMSCSGCEAKVKEALLSIPDITNVEVSKESNTVTITMDKHILLSALQAALSKAGNYTIEMQNHKHPENKQSTVAETHRHVVPNIKQAKPLNQSGIYYCPMHCEGNKTYNQPGNCPVCGMNLEKMPQLHTTSALQYTCPMHPEIISDKPGSCPICGMDLVPLKPAIDEDNKIYLDLRKKFIVALIFTLPVFILAMSSMFMNNPLAKIIPMKVSNWIQFILSFPVIFYSTWMFFQRAWVSFKTLKLNMFSLIGLGTSAAYIFSIVGLLFPSIFPDVFKGHDGSVHLYFEAVVVILTLVLLGQLMEAKAHTQTGNAIKELLKLSPTDATLVKDGVDTKILIQDIQLGDILRVKPGDKIPVDGILVEGSATVDESMITGEPIPVDKVLNDKVTSGTINGTKSFLIKAERIGQDTLLAQIIEMVNSASRSKAPIQKLADEISKYFVPIVIGISILTFIVWAIFGGEQRYMYALVNAVAVLIVACPCALGLATPMSVMVGVGKGARNGVLIKNAEALETMNKANVLIVDKTGTLTEGKPSLEIVVSAGSMAENTLLEYAAALNQSSEHPLAEAIVKKAKENNISIPAVQDFESVSGKGVTGILNAKRIAVGNNKLMENEQAEISNEMLKEITVYQQKGKTVSCIAIDKKVEGFVVISDAIKQTSKTAIQSLMAAGVDVVMLTGDNEYTAKAVAEEMGIRHFKAQCLPEDKLAEIKRLQAENKIVAMAGDGINDAPALAQSSIGIAMGTGTDVAIESAAITLLKGDLMGIVKAKQLSKQTIRNIKQNLFFAFVYNVLGVPVAAGILYPFLGILMSPIVAAAAMSFSSVSVILNSLRLNKIKL